MALDVAILSEDDNGRQKCVNAGTCDLGCAAGAKGGANFTYWPILENAGVNYVLIQGFVKSKLIKFLAWQKVSYITDLMDNFIIKRLK